MYLHFTKLTSSLLKLNNEDPKNLLKRLFQGFFILY